MINTAKFFLVFVVWCQINQTSAIAGLGPCPDVPVENIISLKQGFVYANGALDAVSFLGTWYALLKTSDFKPIVGECTRSHYYLTDDGKVAAFLSEIVDGKNSSIVAEVIIDPLTAGQLYVKFFRFAPLGDYKIIHTDYVNTALVLSCHSLLLGHFKYAWVIARDPFQEIPKYYKDIIEKYGIHKSDLVLINHKNCEK